MHETLNLLTIIDDKIKRNHLAYGRKLHSLSNKNKYVGKKVSKYPYAKAIDFRESKYNEYPKWITEKEGFADFMYKNYENKIMSIPHICQKEHRESDQKYFVELFLNKIDFFRNLPHQVVDFVLGKLKTRYYKVGEVVYNQEDPPQFIGIVYLGSVEYKIGKRNIFCEKNEVILKDAFLGRTHPTIRCRQETILLTLDRCLWPDINKIVKRELQLKERNQLNDMLKSSFFAQLHMKDRKARQFYQSLNLEFYFKGQTLQEAGSEEKTFYILYRGSIEEYNHIYVREHNKWPMPNRRWEVRAVYNSYNQNKLLKKFDFFGDEEIIQNSKFKAKYVAKECTIIFRMNSELFYKLLNQQDIKRLKKYRAQSTDVNYGDFETRVRERAQSTSNRKKIVLKAISTSLAHKSEFSPKKMQLINSYEKSMLRRAVFDDNTISC